MEELQRGWEILYALEKDKIKSKRDVIILLLHHLFLKNGARVVISGPRSSRETEILPSDWNTGEFKLIYALQGKRLTVTGSVKNGVFTIYLRSESKDLLSHVKLEQEVESLTGTLDDMVPNHLHLLNILWENLILPILSTQPRPTVRAETSRAGSNQDTPSREPILQEYVYAAIPFVNPYGIGAQDLNPLAVGGGGMLMDGPRGAVPGPARDFPRPGLPRGSVPPGARFDPFGPVDPTGREPDPDHLPMPGGRFNIGGGGNSGMFM